MRAHVLLLSVLLCACAAHARHMGFRNGAPTGPQVQGRVIKSSQCFGLSRRTRTVNYDLPLLYNRNTGQTSPIPNHLLEADSATIKRLEDDGWEVRLRRVCMPQHYYERVPVCCPWDSNCAHNQGQQPSSIPGHPGPCANGGQLVYVNGLRRCECPPGFKGLWCQIADPVSKVTQSGSAPFPSGPLMRSRPVSPYQDMLTQAELWRRKQAMMDQSRQRPSPMLTPGEHLLRSMNGPWAQQVAMWHQQMLMRLVAQWCQRNGLSRVPYELMRAVQSAGGNPYAMQGRLPPQMAQALSGMNQNPYSVPQAGQNQGDVLVHRLVSQTPGPMTGGPYMRMPQQTPYGDPRKRLPPNQFGQDNPYSVVRPYNDDNRALRGPAARTPWDLDPFQKSPNMAGGRPRGQTEQERQLMALALYKFMQNQQRGRGVHPRPNIPGPVPAPQPDLMDGSEIYSRQPGMAPQVARRGPMPPQISSQDQDEEVTNPYNNMPGSLEPKPTEAPQMAKDAPMPQMRGDGSEMPQIPPTGGRMPPMSMMQGGAPMPNGAPMPGGAPMAGDPRGRPSPQELAKIEECRVELEPRMDNCLIDYQITMKQFMDPEYMAKAKTVCQSSAPVGQCLMQLDKVCGETEQDVMVTRKMINSVLQMMGMICQQIMARGDTAMPVPPNMPRPAPMIPTTNDATESANDVPAPEEPRPPIAVDEEPSKPEAVDESAAFIPPTKDNAEKFEMNGENMVGEQQEAPKHAASKADHDASEPVTHEKQLFGYPMWLIVSLFVVLLAVSILTILLVCLCVRRRMRNQKAVDLQKEIEKMPQPLDGAKLATIGVPPPVYTTTPVHQTSEGDGLCLPPLVINEENEEYQDEKQPPEEPDADDESDEKEENGEKKEKKKEKKEKKEKK